MPANFGGLDDRSPVSVPGEPSSTLELFGLSPDATRDTPTVGH
jgi:hypothetical protein